MAWVFSLQHGGTESLPVSFTIPELKVANKLFSVATGKEEIDDIYIPETEITTDVIVGGHVSVHKVPDECEASSKTEAMVWARYIAAQLGATIVDGSVVEA